MNLSNYTIKAAEAVQQAQQLAFNAQCPNIETAHILKALLSQEDTTVTYLLKKNNVTTGVVATKLDELVAKLPKTSGGRPANQPGSEPIGVAGRRCADSIWRRIRHARTFTLGAASRQ